MSSNHAFSPDNPCTLSADNAFTLSSVTLSSANPCTPCDVDIIVTHNAISANITSSNSINIANNLISDNADTCVKANSVHAISSVDCVRVSAVSLAYACANALSSDSLVS